MILIFTKEVNVKNQLPHKQTARSCYIFCKDVIYPKINLKKGMITKAEKEFAE